jgi:pumilio family protein 6
MGKTHASKMKARDDRLQTLPRKARFAQSAAIKKKEGRVLDSNEKRAIKMKGSHGEILRAWEVLRASADKVDEKIEAMKVQAKQHGAAESSIALAKEDFTNATGRREAAVTKVLGLLKPKFDEVARTPTISRVIQSCIKFGTTAQRTQILLLFTPNFTQYCTDGFAHFAIEALIRHATKADYRSMFNLVLNVMNSLATHKCGIRVVNALYNHKLSSTTEKHLLVLGIFKDSVAVMKSWKGYPMLEEIIEHEASHRKRILTSLFDVTDKLVSQKEAVDYPFVQRLLCILFARGGKEQVEELAASIKGNLVAMAATREGARLASMAIGVLAPRSRKVVLQAVLENFEELTMGKYSPPFVARCFDLTYDPQMAQKFLVAPLVAKIGPVAGSPYGCRILLHMLTPEADRKAKVMLPGYEEHNLYSRSNKNWNHHLWYDSKFEEEIVEICPKSAEASHQAMLGPIAKAFVETVCKVKGLEENKTLKGFVARIASEMLHVHETFPAYRKALDLDDDAIAILQSLQSNKDKRAADGADEAHAAKGATSPKQRPSAPAQHVELPTPKTDGRRVGQKSERPQEAAAATPAARPSKQHTTESASSKKPVASPSPAARVSAAPTATPKTAQKASKVAVPEDDDAPLEETAANVAPPGFDDEATPSRAAKNGASAVKARKSLATAAAAVATPARTSSAAVHASTGKKKPVATPGRASPASGSERRSAALDKL